MDEKVIAVVPAFNEAGCVGKVLGSLVAAREKGLIQEVVVVDDGSTDGTRKIAEGYGVTVIRHTENLGKSQAFISAVGYCKNRKADVMFMTDADMLNLDVDKIGEFLSHIVGRRDVDMLRVGYQQGEFVADLCKCPPSLSGFRAVRVSAVEPLFKLDRLWWLYLNEGFSLETGLENLIEKKAEAPDLGLKSGARASLLRPAVEIASGISWAHEVRDDQLKRRLFQEKMSWLVREQPGHPLVADFRRQYSGDVEAGLRESAARMDSSEIRDRAREIDSLRSSLERRSGTPKVRKR